MKKSLIFIAAFVFLSSCISFQNTSTQNNYPSASSGNFERDMLQLVNHYRTKGYRSGGGYHPPVAPVKWNTQLEAAAKGHSNYMSANNVLSHRGRNGSDPGRRIAAAGYKWSTFGENVAMGQQTAEEVMNTWMRSASHRKNIMNKNVKEMGVAKTGRYWTQVFASK